MYTCGFYVNMIFGNTFDKSNLFFSYHSLACSSSYGLLAIKIRFMFYSSN